MRWSLRHGVAIALLIALPMVGWLVYRSARATVPMPRPGSPMKIVVYNGGSVTREVEVSEIDAAYDLVTSWVKSAPQMTLDMISYAPHVLVYYDETILDISRNLCVYNSRDPRAWQYSGPLDERWQGLATAIAEAVEDQSPDSADSNE